MTRTNGLQTFSNELLKEILDQIDADPEQCVSIDRRAYLSVESFRPPSPPLPSRAQDIGNFRLVCRRFSESGVPYQFTRIATRFSVSGFRRLEKIANRDYLAKHTRKFSYLMPFFYIEGRPDLRDVLRAAHEASHNLDSTYFEAKARDQTTLVKTREDLRVLKKAMSAFTSLQHVQILRLQDEADCQLLDFLQEGEAGGARAIDLRWTPACFHATKTMGEALMYARSPFSRFSGPMMNTQSMLAIGNSIPQILPVLSSRLTCLELHFDDGLNLDEKLRAISHLFHSIFSAAKSLQALHIGFPSHSPLGLGLEEIFHNVQWEKLRAFGIQSWRLDAEEIIQMARRHRRTLRGLRLRDVLLKEGSMWKDVLTMLREEMDLLDWVSLRRVDYSKQFDELWRNSMEVPDDPPGGASDSDDEDNFSARWSMPDDEEISEAEDSDDQSNADTDNGPEANDLALAPDTPITLPFCTCSRSSYPATADDLCDNGEYVNYQQRKMWEKWVIGRCPEHSPS